MVIWPRLLLGVLLRNLRLLKHLEKLSLKEKYDLIETSKKNPGLAARALAAKFGCSRTQINSILRNKEGIIGLYESNMCI